MMPSFAYAAEFLCVFPRSIQDTRCGRQHIPGRKLTHLPTTGIRRANVGGPVQSPCCSLASDTDRVATACKRYAYPGACVPSSLFARQLLANAAIAASRWRVLWHFFSAVRLFRSLPADLALNTARRDFRLIGLMQVGSLV
jgi:hypothetical protein